MSRVSKNILAYELDADIPEKAPDGYLSKLSYLYYAITLVWPIEFHF